MENKSVFLDNSLLSVRHDDASDKLNTLVKPANTRDQVEQAHSVDVSIAARNLRLIEIANVSKGYIQKEKRNFIYKHYNCENYNTSISLLSIT